MAQTPITSTVIAIDIRRSALHYYSMLGSDRASIVHRVKNYAGEPFTEEFYQKFKDAVASFVEDEPSETVRKISVIIPDDAVAQDTLRLPLLRSGRQLNNALSAKINNLYKNYEDLKILTHLAEKNKKYCAYSVAAVQKSIISSISGACAENRLLVDTLTYSSAATAAALNVLNPKMKNENYLFLDIKDIYSRFIFVSGGRATGFFTLPFGLEYLGSRKLIGEDMLFEHSLSELTVINARERARAKKLTQMRELQDTASIENAENEDLENTKTALESSLELSQNSGAGQIKLLPKKTPRKLPQFMQRPIPETHEGIVEEKFRVFVKWGLGILTSNPTLTSIGQPKCVYVNLPTEYQYIFDSLAKEEKENGIPFVRFTDADDDGELAHNLELFGGLNTKLWHPSMKF